jgi:hypothetical protein
MEEKQKKTWGHVKEKGERNNFLQYNKALDSYNVFQCIGKHCSYPMLYYIVKSCSSLLSPSGKHYSYPMVLVKLRALATDTLYVIHFPMFRKNFKKNHKNLLTLDSLYLTNPQ